MTASLAREIANLTRLSVKQLRQRYADLFNEQTMAHNKPWLVKRIAWRLQARAEGGLSEAARRRAAELADEADLRKTPPRTKVATTVELPVHPDGGDSRLPPPGSTITRLYKGTEVTVLVLAHGFEYAGETFASLSAVARAITGSHCNGFHFFKLTRRAGAA